MTNTQWTQEEINQTIDGCKRKSMTDAAFRSKLLTSPNEAIKELSGKEVPAGLKIQVVEQDPSCAMAFILPPMVDGALRDDDLDKIVAAGAIEAAFDQFPQGETSCK